VLPQELPTSTNTSVGEGLVQRIISSLENLAAIKQLLAAVANAPRIEGLRNSARGLVAIGSTTSHIKRAANLVANSELQRMNVLQGELRASFGVVVATLAMLHEKECRLGPSERLKKMEAESARVGQKKHGIATLRALPPQPMTAAELVALAFFKRVPSNQATMVQESNLSTTFLSLQREVNAQLSTRASAGLGPMSRTLGQCRNIAVMVGIFGEAIVNVLPLIPGLTGQMLSSNMVPDLLRTAERMESCGELMTAREALAQACSQAPQTFAIQDASMAAITKGITQAVKSELAAYTQGTRAAICGSTTTPTQPVEPEELIECDSDSSFELLYPK
jgi:hypothetical protein